MRRVVVTGMGVVTPIGNSVNDMWNSILNKKCGIGKLTRFDTSKCDVKLAAEIKDFTYEPYLKPIEAKKMDKFSQYAVVSSIEAFDDSKLQYSNFDNERFSVIFSSGMGGGTISTEYQKILEHGYDYVSKMTITNNLINMAAANIAIKLKALGSCNSIVSACASGTDSVGRAYREIKDGYSDIVLAGASEAAIVPVYVAGFNSIGALSKSTDPLRASIPFDNARSGFVMGEGAGSLILEEFEHAVKRNAHIYAEVIGYGSTCDAHSLTAPDFSLSQGTRAFKYALDEAGVSYDKVDYINAHGTGTKYNDLYETKIIKNVFKEYSYKLAISSTKSYMGHLLGAAGAVESVLTVLSIANKYIPPTIGTELLDKDCDLDYVINSGRDKNVKYAISNSLGFGGHNATIMFKSLEED